MVLGEAVFSLGLTPSKTSALLLANLDSLTYYAATTVSAVRGANEVLRRTLLVILLLMKLKKKKAASLLARLIRPISCG